MGRPKLGEKVYSAADPTGSYDSPEEIMGCMQCVYPDCTNCSKRFRVRNGIKDYDLELMQKYPKFPSFSTLCKAMNSSRWKVENHLRLLGLPDPSTITSKERQKLIKEKLP